MSEKRKITVAYGDGIGPEIMQATIDILIAAGAQIDTEVIEIGEKVFEKAFLPALPMNRGLQSKKTRFF